MTNSSLVVFLMDDINLELEQLHRRNKIGPSCYPQASTWMIASCIRRFGILGGKDVLEDQNLSLMKDYKEIKDLPIQNGFAGDEIRQKMTANVDLWEIYIKVLKCFQNKSDFATSGSTDQGPERPVRVCKSSDSWQLVITAKGFWQASSKLEKAG